MFPPIATALLSFGLSGQVFHAPFLHRHPGFRLLGAWERRTPRIADAYPGTRRYATLDALLADPAVALVVVNTPIPTHFAYARQALLAGKHVVVEKAFTTTVAEAEELVALARARGQVLSVYQNRRWDSDFQTVQGVLASGELGPLVAAELRFDRFRPAVGTKAAVETPGPGAGTLFDLGPHLLDQALVLFGWPQTVRATLRQVRAGTRVVDWVEIELTYAPGGAEAGPELRVRLSISPLAPPGLPAYQLYGQRGAFLKSRADPQEAALRAHPGAPLGPDWGLEPTTAAGQLTRADATGAPLPVQAVPSQRGDYGRFYDALHQALTTGAPPPVAADPDGLRVMRLLAAAQRSHDTGQVVSL